MTKRWLWLIGLIVLAAPLTRAQMTAVSALVMDSNGERYVNCSWSVVFVGQNNVPGAGPYQPAALLVGQQGHCDSSGNLTASLADNIATVRPTPSQWNFSICSAPGYVPGGTYCRSNMLVTVTGQTQNLTSFFQPLMPLLPTGGGGGGGGSGFITDATPLGGLMKTGTTLGLQTTCVAGQYMGWNGSAWACTGAGVGGGTSVTVNSTAAVPNQLNFTNTLIPPSGSTVVNFLLNGTTVGAYITGTGGGGGGTPFTVNGVTPTGTVNFNASSPGPPPNGINVNWTLVGTGLTAAIVGDGNPNSCLLGTGIFAACPGGGGGGGTPLPTIPQYNLYASNGAGGAQDSAIKAGPPGFLEGEVLTATGDITSAPSPFQIFPNASVEYFPTGYAWSGGTAGAANGFAGYFSHSSGTTAATNGGIGLGGGNSSGSANQIYLDCEIGGCDFKVPLTVNGGAVGGGGGITGATANGGLLQTGFTLGLLTSCTANQYLSWSGSAWVCTTLPAPGGVTSINSVAGAFSFTGAGVSCSGTTCTFSGGGGGSGTVSSGTANQFAWYAATGTTVSSNGHLTDSGTTITSTLTLAAPGLNVTGSGGISMTGTGGTLPAPVASQGGIGIGPGNVPQFYSNGGVWTNIGSSGATLPTIPVNNLYASNGSGGAQDSNVQAMPSVGGSGAVGTGYIKSGASVVGGTGGGTSPFTGQNASQEWYGAGGTITPSTGSPVTFTNGAAVFMGHSASTAGATGDGGLALGGGSATPTSRVYLDCEVAGCDFKVPITLNGSAIGGGGLPAGMTWTQPTLTLAASGGVSGTLALGGSTSGAATIAGPASPGVNGQGFVFNSGINVSSGYITLGSNSDVTLTRGQNGFLRVGNANGSNESAFIGTYNSCPIPLTAFSSPTTPANPCNRNLPLVARTWIIHCIMPFNYTAGTGATTVTFNIVIGAAPTAVSTFVSSILSPSASPTYVPVTIPTTTGTTQLIQHGTSLPDTNTYTMRTDGVVNAPGGNSINLNATISNGTAQLLSGGYCRYE